jgi:hypothetical protein
MTNEMSDDAVNLTFDPGLRVAPPTMTEMRELRRHGESKARALVRAPARTRFSFAAALRSQPWRLPLAGALPREDAVVDLRNTLVLRDTLRRAGGICRLWIDALVFGSMHSKLSPRAWRISMPTAMHGTSLSGRTSD